MDFITFVSYPSWAAFSLLAASLIFSLRYDLSLTWSRFLTHVICDSTQFVLAFECMLVVSEAQSLLCPSVPMRFVIYYFYL